MSHVRPGFFLLEFIVALAIFSLSALYGGHLLLNVYGAVKKITVCCMTDAKLHLAAAYVHKELSKAPCIKRLWKKMNRDQAIWTIEDEDYAIVLDKSRLLYVKGTFDTTSNKWIAKEQNVIYGPLESISFGYHGIDSNISAITFALDGKEEWCAQCLNYKQMSADNIVDAMREKIS